HHHDIRPDTDHGDHGQERDHERRRALLDIRQRAATADAVDDEQVDAEGWRDHRRLDQQHQQDAVPDRVVAGLDHERRRDGDGRDHHGELFHEGAQHEVEDDHRQQDLYRRHLVSSDQLAELLGEADRLDDDVEEEGADQDRYHHRRRAHGAFADVAQHAPREPAAPGGDRQSADDADGGGLGRRRDAEEDGADHDQQEHQRRQQVGQELDAHLPVGLDPVATPLRLPHAGDQHREAEQHRQDEARQEAREIELGHRGIGHHAVDDHVDRGRDQDAQ